MAFTPDQEKAIYTSGTNIIVSAGAGSGKTAVLSERVLQKVLSGTHVNELLILTFTKAAADEMKNRIRKKLSDLEGYENEVNLISSSYITTFDSFALSVVKKYHYLLNIPSNVGISDESIIKIKETEIMDNVFDYFYEIEEVNFLKFIKDNCLKSDKNLRKDILNLANNINKNSDSIKMIDELKYNYFSDGNIDKLISEYESFINDKIKFIKSFLSEIDNYFDSNYVERVYDALNDILESNIDSLYLFSKPKLPNAPKGSSEEAKLYKKELADYVSDLISYGVYGNREKIKNDILESKNTIFVILDIVRKYIVDLNEYKSLNKIYTFQDIAYNAIKVVSENDEVRLELKNSFKEIMIDEYQDTNNIQDTFIKLISDNNVYMVGDIKQSIYRFNNANPSIFKDKYDSYSVHNNGEKIDLIKNFRSRSEVLKGINDLFRLLMDNDIGGCDYKTSHEMIYGLEDYNSKTSNIDYNMEILEYESDESKKFSNKEIEIFSIVNDIKSKINNGLEVYDKDSHLMRKAKYSDFAIILDRSKEFELYKKIFEYNGIPLYVLRSDKLKNTTDINLIKNIIDLIIRIHDKDYGVEFKYAFMSVARSFLYEMDDNILFDIVTNNKFNESVIYKDLESVSNFNSLTCGELFERLLEVTDFYNKLYKIGSYDEIDKRISTIYDLSLGFNNLGYSIYEFRDYLDDVISSDIDIDYESGSSNYDAVKLMTIHKSKGLEYPVCYFSDIDHDFNLMDIKKSFIFDSVYGLMIPFNDGDVKNSIIKELFINSYMKEEISERIRLFYVALTRAREKIIVVLPSKEKKIVYKDENGLIPFSERVKIRRLSDLIYLTKNYISDYFKSLDINEIGLTKDYLFNNSKKNSIGVSDESFDVVEVNIESNVILKEHFSKENIKVTDKESHDNMDFGTRVHEVFELIDFNNFDESSINDKFISSKVSKFLDNDLLKDKKNANIYHEYEFIYNKDNIEYHGIIDLMMEYSNHIDIIDFKLKHVSDEAYVNQLHGYKEYIESISNKKVYTYLYSIIDEKISEIK